MAKKVRILMDASIDGIGYKPNDVVEFGDAQAKALVKAGTADDAVVAVAYCVNELKAKVKEHPGARTQPAPVGNGQTPPAGTGADTGASGTTPNGQGS